MSVSCPCSANVMSVQVNSRVCHQHDGVANECMVSPLGVRYMAGQNTPNAPAKSCLWNHFIHWCVSLLGDLAGPLLLTTAKPEFALVVPVVLVV